MLVESAYQNGEPERQADKKGRLGLPEGFSFGGVTRRKTEWARVALDVRSRSPVRVIEVLQEVRKHTADFFRRDKVLAGICNWVVISQPQQRH